jgi:predicted ferric reductase
MGLLAGVLLMLQFALSARLKLLDRAFGLDRLLRYHKYLGISAGLLASLHPLFLYSSGVYSVGSMTWNHWPELLGASLLAVLWVVLCTSLWAAFLGLSYRQWWGIHQLVFVAVVLVVVHGLVIGSNLAGGWPQVVWTAVVATYAGLFVWVKVVKPLRLWTNRYIVAAVEQLNHNVWTVELTTPPERAFHHLPGQFAFLKLHGRGLPAEEHPFTISSAPSPDGRRIRFTIKASGDFTARISEFHAGDWATVDGPYGLFSHLVRAPRSEPLVMIAGGIGITPILSMLRHMAATGDDRPVTLIWGNRREEDIVYRQELDSLAAGRMNLRIHHVLSEQESWPGSTGFVDAPLLGRVLAGGELAGQVFLCGPPVMMASVSRSLRSMNVPRRRIHTERFAF